MYAAIVLLIRLILVRVKNLIPVSFPSKCDSRASSIIEVASWLNFNNGQTFGEQAPSIFTAMIVDNAPNRFCSSLCSVIYLECHYTVYTIHVLIFEYNHRPLLDAVNSIDARQSGPIHNLSMPLIRIPPHDNLYPPHSGYPTIWIHPTIWIPHSLLQSTGLNLDTPQSVHASHLDTPTIWIPPQSGYPHNLDTPTFHNLDSPHNLDPPTICPVHWP